jgi:DnaJ-class molecular chaperone
MRRCEYCAGTGKHEAYFIEANNTVVHIPEQICKFCKGKGVIDAPQFKGCPLVYGNWKSVSTPYMKD